MHEQETKIKEIPCTAIANIDFKLFGIAYVCAMNSLFECVVVVAPVMHEANHRSAMYTQLLAGDLVERVEDLPSVWMAVKLQGDAMIGYVLKAHVRATQRTIAHPHCLLPGELGYPTQPYGSFLVPGTRYILEEGSRARTAGFLVELSQKSNQDLQPELLRNLLDGLLGCPYQWGGITPWGIDCSGLVVQFYRWLGLSLPHLASKQFELGETVDFIQSAQFGDLAFFEDAQGIVYHVGILLNDREMIHSSERNGGVAIDWIDQEGIVNKRSMERTHKLRLIRRLHHQLA